MSLVQYLFVTKCKAITYSHGISLFSIACIGDDFTVMFMELRRPYPIIPIRLSGS